MTTIARTLLLATLLAITTASAKEKDVDLGNYALHFVINDRSSDYTILLEAGGGADSSMWSGLQDKLAEATGYNVVSYDRAGFGASGFGPPELGPTAQLDDLVTALDRLGYDNNLVVVAHSYGGLLAESLAASHADAVAGLMLIDPMNARFVARYGLDRLMASAPHIDEPRDRAQAALKRMIDTMPALIKTMTGVDLAPSLPVYIISAGSPPYDDTPRDVADWHASHAEMVASSPRHVLVEAPDNSHNLVQENPELILATMTKLKAAITLP